ncbi:MAG: hypothetical protein KF724_00400 [Phycisphaeraceae bacterium]|nr:hypothetical protein [Phycisphaeraceae bacterium]
MRIDLRDAARQRIGRVSIESSQRPTLVRVERRDDASDAPTAHDVFLNWDQAVDDAGCLRHCIACGGRVFRSRSLPQVTPVVVVLAVAGVLVAAFGLAANPLVYAALVAVLLLDIGVLLVARTRLICYRCGSIYDRVPVARYHTAWNRRDAENEQMASPPEAPQPSSASSG